MRTRRLATILALLGLLLGGAAAQAPRARAAEACFPATGFCVRGRFLDYWTANGGLARNGFPLGDERRELLEDGNTYTVQYFERVRLEYHPENPAPYDVLLGQFGRRIGHTDVPEQPRAGRMYFPETSQNVARDFFAYWQANGGLMQFGYPISGEEVDHLEDGRSYAVQYFERARLERHPENAPPYDILLGQFGRRVLAEIDLLSEVGPVDTVHYTPFGVLYVTNTDVRKFAGTPEGPALRVPGALQPFERGRMLYLAGQPAGAVAIIAECSPTYAPTGTLVYIAEADSGDPTQPTGGGPGPGPGLYEPRSGFGKVWREHGLQSCLGYATTPDAQPTIVTIQPFQRARLLTTPDVDTVDLLFADVKHGWRADTKASVYRYPRP